MINALTRYLKNENGAAAIEYALITSMISILIIASLTQVGLKLSDTITLISDTIQNANNDFDINN